MHLSTAALASAVGGDPWAFGHGRPSSFRLQSDTKAGTKSDQQHREDSQKSNKKSNKKSLCVYVTENSTSPGLVAAVAATSFTSSADPVGVQSKGTKDKMKTKSKARGSTQSRSGFRMNKLIEQLTYGVSIFLVYCTSSGPFTAFAASVDLFVEDRNDVGQSRFLVDKMGTSNESVEPGIARVMEHLLLFKENSEIDVRSDAPTKAILSNFGSACPAGSTWETSETGCSATAVAMGLGYKNYNHNKPVDSVGCCIWRSENDIFFSLDHCVAAAGKKNRKSVCNPTIAPIDAPTKAILSNFGSACPAGSTWETSETGCSATAVAMGLVYKSYINNKPLDSVGCCIWRSDNDIFFFLNNCVAEAGKKNRKSVCNPTIAPTDASPTDAPSGSPTSSPTPFPGVTITRTWENGDRTKRFSFSTDERARLFNDFRSYLCGVDQWRDGIVLRQVTLLVFLCHGEDTCDGRTSNSIKEEDYFQVGDVFSKGNNFAKVEKGAACLWSPTSSPTPFPGVTITRIWENGDRTKRFSFSTDERARLFNDFRSYLCGVDQWRDGIVLRQVTLLVFLCHGEDTCGGRTSNSTKEEDYFQVGDVFSKGNNFAKVEEGAACLW